MTVQYRTSYYIVLLHSINSILTLRSVAFCPVASCLSGLLSCGLLSVAFCPVAFCPVAFCRGPQKLVTALKTSATFSALVLACVNIFMLR